MVKDEISKKCINEIVLKSLEAYSDPIFINSGVISWAPPIISFGSLSNATVGTVGLNPSNLEFVDQSINELNGSSRRFHTLSSLGIKNWTDVDDLHISKILEMNELYFNNNPYDTWFKKLDYILAGSNLSYYFPVCNTCHLDIVPYATTAKWNELKIDEREYLIKKSKDILGLLLRESKIRFLILNGQSVVDNFQKVSGVRFNCSFEPLWDLKRKSGNNIKGKSFIGSISRIGNIELKRDIIVIGFNHNIQSSFGITKNAMNEIKNWVSHQYNIYKP